MDQIRELLQRLDTLNTEELAQLRKLILKQNDDLDKQDASAEVAAQRVELADAADKLMEHEAALETAKQEAQAASDAAKERIAKLNGTDDTDPEEPTADAITVDEPAEEPAADADVTTDTPEAVAASGARPRGLTGRGRKPEASPEQPTTTRNRAVLTAAGAMRDMAGKELDNREDLAKGMSETLRRMNRDSAARGDVILASAHWNYPEDRVLGSDALENMRKIEAATNPQALVATGGICAPVNVDYSVGTWAAADRPLRDGLVAFQASRGGLSYVQPPSLAALAGATSIWTEATDADPAGATKPVIAIQCGTEETILVDAVPTRLGFGNMQSRFAPEQVAANTDLAIAAAARIAEVNLLNKLAASSIKVTTSQYLGASRDLLATLLQAAAGFRSAYRIPRTQMFTVTLPEWLMDEMKIDILNEIGHAATTELDVRNVTDDQVNAYLASKGVNVIWTLDGQPASSGNYPAQVFNAQTAAALQGFPDKVVAYFFIEGTVQFLDGGRLDLGVVRDSTLDATNDYETFVETFEGLAYRGFANGLWQLVIEIVPNGATVGTITPTAWA